MLILFIILTCVALIATHGSADVREQRLMAALTALFTLAAMAVWLVQRGVL